MARRSAGLQGVEYFADVPLSAICGNAFMNEAADGPAEQGPGSGGGSAFSD